MLEIPEQFKKQIKQKFQNNFKSASTFTKLFKQIEHTQLNIQLTEIFQKYKDIFIKKSNVILWIINDIQEKYCISCGKLLNLNKLIKSINVIKNIIFWNKKMQKKYKYKYKRI